MNICTWVWLFWQITPTGNPVFLHYTVLFGVDSIGDWSQIFRVPELGLGLLVLNGLVGWLAFQKDKYLSHFFNAVGLLCQLFLLIASVILVALNV